MRWLKNSWQGIEGVTVIDSGKKWPNVGIVGLVHWNEPVILKIFEELGKIEIRQGKLFLILANPKAWQLGQRLVNHNLNRIWNQPIQSWSYEFQRMQELQMVLDELDVVIDIHSVSQGDEVMAIGDIGDIELLKKLFDVPWILVDDMLNSGTLISYLLEQGKKGFGLEVGNHSSYRWAQRWIEFVKNLLIWQEMIEGEIASKKYSQKVLRFWQEIFPSSEEFEFVQKFDTFTFLPKWEIYAQDKKQVFRVNQDAWIGLVAKNIQVGDGAGFLFLEE